MNELIKNKKIDFSNNFKRIEILLSCIGIDEISFLNFLEWALNEQLLNTIIQNFNNEDEFFAQKDALKKFRKLLRDKTQKNWSVDDLNKLYDSVKNKIQKHYREKISYGEYLKLLWNKPHKCACCSKTPPDVKLHIDHIRPVSLGGKSKFSNLQFLCSNCNLKKSNKLIGGKPWLKLL